MIYLVSLYYPPVSNPPSNRMQHMARVLVGEYGAENVTVVTGRPNYPAGKLAAEDRWRLCRREKGQWGETVMHLYEIPAPFQGLYLKTLGQVSFAVSFAFYLLFRRYRPGEVVFITSGPIFQVYVAWIMSKVRRGLRYVMDIRDLWPQTVAGLGHMKEDSTAFRILKSWTDRAHRSAFASVGVVEGIHDYIREVAPDRPAHLIYNPVDTDLFVPDSEASVGAFRQQHPELFGDSSKTVFLYAGVHSHAIDLVTMMRAVVQLAAMRSDFVFLVIGYGEETDSIRASHDAVATTDTPCTIDKNHTVCCLVCCADWADLHARRGCAVITEFGNKKGLGYFVFGNQPHAGMVLVKQLGCKAITCPFRRIHDNFTIFFDNITLDPGAGHVGFIGNIVFSFAGLDADAATNTLVGINEETPFKLRIGGQQFLWINEIQSGC